MGKSPKHGQAEIQEITGFSELGFCSREISHSIEARRAENANWFDLAEATNVALVRTANSTMKVPGFRLWAPQAVAVRMLLRSCGAFQGVILLTERGMVAEGRTLVRNLIESAICIAAVHEQPERVVQILRDDSEAARQRQRRFIDAKNLIEEGAARERLRKAIDELGKFKKMNIKEVAEFGPFESSYLSYQRLSDDSCHLTARALHRHVLSDEKREGWQYRWSIGDRDENSVTLHYAIMAALAVGVGVAQILEDRESNALFGPLSERFGAMPPIPAL